MELIEIENQLKELLLPIFGLDSVEEIQPHHALVHDLQADSLDFVEMMYVIERDFGVVLKVKEIVLGTAEIKEETVFQEDQLTEDGATLLKQQFPESAAQITAGMSKVEIFSLITVRDLAKIISAKLTQST